MIIDTHGHYTTEPDELHLRQIVDTCKKHNVAVGHPHVETANTERVIREGYRFLMCAAPRNFTALETARSFAARASTVNTVVYV